MDSIVMGTGPCFRICRDCGTAIIDCGRRTIRCPACAKRQQRVYGKHSRDRERAERQQAVAKKRDTNLNEVAKAATDAGMSYGTYVAFRMGGGTA